MKNKISIYILITMASIFAQKPIKYYESLTWEQLSEELKKVGKGVKKKD